MLGSSFSATSGFNAMNRGIVSSREMISNHPLKMANRNYPTARKTKKLKLKINRKIRNKARDLSKKVNSRILFGPEFFWAFVASLILIVYLCEYWYCILGTLLVLVILKIMIATIALGMYSKITVSKKMRKSKISFSKNTAIESSNPGPIIS